MNLIYPLNTSRCRMTLKIMSDVWSIYSTKMFIRVSLVRVMLQIAYSFRARMALTITGGLLKKYPVIVDISQQVPLWIDFFAMLIVFCYLNRQGVGPVGNRLNTTTLFATVSLTQVFILRSYFFFVSPCSFYTIQKLLLEPRPENPESGSSYII